MKRLLTILVTVLFFVAAVILGLKNQQSVTLHFIIAQNELRLSTLLAFIFMIGFFVATLLASYFHFALKIKNRRLQRNNKKQLQLIHELRAQTEKD